MEEKLGQSTAVLFKYEKLILAEEETTSAGGCGVSLAAFSRPASACLYDSAAWGFFLSLESHLADHLFPQHEGHHAAEVSLL